jgi:hypothetical protein
VVNCPSALTSLAQVLSSLNVTVIHLTMHAARNDSGLAEVAVRLETDERLNDLVRRKFERLIDVVQIE